MAVKSLADLLAEGVEGRGVLVRCDLNVPLDENGIVTDTGRIDASVPTLKALSEAGAKVVVTAHLGRPKGGPDPKFSLAPVARVLGEKLGRHVQLAGDVVGTDALAQRSESGPVRNIWYGTGPSARFFLRVTGNSTTTGPYGLEYNCVPYEPIAHGGGRRHSRTKRYCFKQSPRSETTCESRQARTRGAAPLPGTEHAKA